MFPSRILATKSNTFLIAFSFSFTNSSGSSSNWHLTSVGKTKSIGSLGNRPYTIWNGDTPLVTCTGVLYANPNGFKYSSQSSRLCLMKHRNIPSRVPLKRSVCPSNWGWLGVVRDLSMSSKASGSLNNSTSKDFPWSVKIRMGNECLQIYAKNHLTTSAAVCVGIASRSMCVVQWSAMVRMYL